MSDVFNRPKRYGIIVITFILCFSPFLILANTANTLKSNSLITSFGLTESDVYFSDEKTQMSFMTENGEEMLLNHLDKMELALADNGMPAKCSNQVFMKLTLTYGDNICQSQTYIGIGINADMYKYNQGTPPQNSGEVAITKAISKRLGAQIGDTITIRQLDGDKQYIVTALFRSMNNLGEVVRLHESAPATLLHVSYLPATLFHCIFNNFQYTLAVYCSTRYCAT